jgi:hypothetical protein
VLIVDTASLPDLGWPECTVRQKLIAEYMTGIKGEENENEGPTEVRVAYVEANGEGAETRISLEDSDFNADIFDATERSAYHEWIEDRDCLVGAQSRPALVEAIEEALALFEAADSDALGRSKKIIIFSSRGVSQSRIDEACNSTAPHLRNGRRRNGVNVLMGNFQEDQTNDRAFDSASVSAHCDNYAVLSLSRDGGATFEEIATESDWPNEIME